jgi:hypothetical protein
MSESQPARDDATRRTNEGNLTPPERGFAERRFAERRFDPIAGTVSVSELQPGDKIKNFIEYGQPLTVVSIEAPAGLEKGETSRRIITVTGHDGDAELSVWVWKFSRVERVENA